MRKFLFDSIIVILFIFLFALLTILTQVGGVILIIHLIIYRIAYRKIDNSILRNTLGFTQFCLIYLLCTFLIIPEIAPKYGRVALPTFSDETTAIVPLNLITCLANRHYITPTLNNELVVIGREFQNKYPNSQVNYLDANFPFFDNFPLLPHISHNDGEKIDLAFYYQDKQSKKPLYNDSPSPIGYGVFEYPKKGEQNMPKVCENRGNWQYSFMEKIIPQKKKSSMVLDEKRTRELIRLCAERRLIRKIFLEPHLKTRMRLNYQKIRFHGCHSVRHDDHIHIEL